MHARLVAAFAAAGLASPVLGQAAVDRTTLDHAQLRALPVGGATDITEFPLADGSRVDLALERFDVLAASARVIAANGDHEVAMTRPDVVLLRGFVAGAPDSRVFIASSAHGTNGFIKKSGVTHIISSGPFGDAFAAEAGTLVSTIGQMPPATIDIPTCATEPGTRVFGRPGPVQEGSDGIAGGPCRVARIAVDTDWQFTQIFGGDTSAAAAYAVSLFGAVSEIYTAEMNVRLVVTYLRTWATDNDPYPDEGDLLQPFRSEWSVNQNGIVRELAHMLSGRNNLPYGGVAYLSAVCSNDIGYGVSGYLNGSFPYPLQDNHGGNWDIVVVAHELGHNFGTTHTHNFNPPVDNCGNGDCGDADLGTIMSYCHTCSGGMTNIELTFGPVPQGAILGYLNGTCDITADAVSAIEDNLSTFPVAGLDIEVLLNDLAASCDVGAVAIGSYDATSAQGGVIELLPGPDASLDRLRYNAVLDYEGVDSFTYSLVGGQAATVTIEISALREAVIVPAPALGLKADYYALSSPAALPDFSLLTPDSNEIAAQVNYPSTSGAFAGSGLSDNVGAVFTGFIKVTDDALYTLYTNSDDGSRLYIGNDLVVENDGLHGMVEQSGTIALASGAHPMRIEYFEAGGGAGLILSIEGGGLGKQVVPASRLYHDTGTGPAADINGDGIVDAADLASLLDAWGPNPGHPADLDSDGTVGPSDLAQLLDQWS